MSSVAGRLEGLTAIVAGGGQQPGQTVGNGRAASILFARAGATVLVGDRDAARAGETAEMIAGEGGKAVAIELDVTSKESCEAAVQRALDETGRLDIVLNNVGIGGGGDTSAHWLPEDVFDRMIDVNLKGAWRMTAAAIPALRETEGNIINISSLAAIATSGMTAYEVTKAALNRLTVNVALGNAKYGVRCNAIAPGLMDTPMAIERRAAEPGSSHETVRAARNARVPLKGKMGNGWDTAHAALFLASAEARFITGIVLPVDGGGGARVG
ncbi:MAG: SDR family NAD(P)-dependent oxidoreductase [Minwuia sp.]|uniref:SDR family NAD(P)-dependent oxidoreductase n=1 Tax=Minwuia sp. TaxID=2493630 RepID=UPI003A86C904